MSEAATTRERLKQALPVLQAYADGKAWQILNSFDKWVDPSAPDRLLWAIENGHQVRVKPQTKLIPWSFERHPGGAVFLTSGDGTPQILIGKWSASGVQFTDGIKQDYATVLAAYKQLDGSPCGWEP